MLDPGSKTQTREFHGQDPGIFGLQAARKSQLVALARFRLASITKHFGGEGRNK